MGLFDDLKKGADELDDLFDELDGKKKKPLVYQESYQSTNRLQRPRQAAVVTEEEPGFHRRLHEEYCKHPKLCMQCSGPDGCSGPMVQITRRCRVCFLLSCEECMPDPNKACNHCTVQSNLRKEHNERESSTTST